SIYHVRAFTSFFSIFSTYSHIYSLSLHDALPICQSFIFLFISTIFIGITLGGMFALALSLLAMRAKNAKDASYLSGMAQAIGYLIAAIGPIVIGYLHDITGTWQIPLLTLLGITILVIIFGLGAGRNRYV